MLGLLLFLWLTFGGSIPLRAEGYRFNVSFPEADQLAAGGRRADLRREGRQGQVEKADTKTGLTDAMIEWTPVRADAGDTRRSCARRRCWARPTWSSRRVGERPARARRRHAAAGRRRRTVELDEIFRTFDPKTRRAFQTWLQQTRRRAQGAARTSTTRCGSSTPFAEDAGDDVLTRPAPPSGATPQARARHRRRVRRAERARGQLARLIRNSNHVFETTAARDRQLAETFVALPTFQREARTTRG